MIMKFFLLIALIFSQVAFADEGRSWMKRVAGHRSLAELSIPGTHDSCALYGGVYGQCQTMTLPQQFESGVRFLDIRCRAIEDRFQIHHGMIDQKITFAEVRDQCEAFLKANPSECILMSVKEEYIAKGNTRGFGETFRAYLQGHEKFWYTQKNVPTLQQARGKIVLISRNQEVSGIPWKSLSVQDKYKVSGAKQIAEKWQLIKNKFKSSRLDRTNTLYVNFCSGASFWSPPNVVSKVINRSLEKYLELGGKKRLGNVLLDFPSKSLIQQVYSSNQGVFAD